MRIRLCAWIVNNSFVFSVILVLHLVPQQCCYFWLYIFVLVSTIQRILETTLCVRDLNAHRGSCTWSMPALLWSIQLESRRKWRCYKEASDPERPDRYQTSETDGKFLHTTTSYNHPISPREWESESELHCIKILSGLHSGMWLLFNFM